VSSLTTNTLTVTRDFGGTQVTLASDATITRIGNARLEGAVASYDRGVSDITEAYNYTQILQDDLRLSRTAQKISQWGINDYFDFEAQQKLKDLLILMEKGFFLGERKSS